MNKLICQTCNITNCECVPYDVECDSCRRAYKQGRAETVKLLFPFVECCDQEGICDEVMGLTMDEHGNTWCEEHCNNFCEGCVLKWLELKEQKE